MKARGQQPLASDAGAPRGTRVLGAAALVATAVFAAFWPALGAGFVGWDDGDLIERNAAFRGLSPAHLEWMLGARLLGHWQPLTWLSYSLDHALWGLDPRGYHLTNLLLHAASAVLVLWLALILLAFAPRRPLPASARLLGATIAALFFGLHPLRVESVAWVTERRDVLSGALLLASLVAWLRARATRESGRAPSAWAGAAALLLFALSLCSKAWGITFPAVLLVLDAWPLRRFGREPLGRLLLEKLPFALLSGACAVQALAAQAESGALAYARDFTLAQRLAQAVHGLCFYVWKTAVPVGLSPLYLLDLRLDPLAPKYVGCALAVAAVTAALFVLRRRWQPGMAAAAIYAVLLAPVLGFAQSGGQAVADRYSYLACLPLALLAGAAAARGLERGSFASRAGLALAAAAGLAALGVAAHRQTRHWHDTESLWSRALAVDPGNWLALSNRAADRLARGELDLAAQDYDDSIRISSDYWGSFAGRAQLRRRRGDVAGALEDFDRAILLAPEIAKTYADRGLTRVDQGDVAGAWADVERALARDPNLAAAWAARGALALLRGERERGLADLTRALALDPLAHGAWYNRAQGREAFGDLAGAVADYERALALAPANWGPRPQLVAKLEAARARL